MSSVLTHCVILLMKPIWDHRNDQQKLNESKGEYMENLMGSMHLKILHLEEADQTELIAVTSRVQTGSSWLV